MACRHGGVTGRTGWVTAQAIWLAEPAPTRHASREEPLQLPVSANSSIMPQAAPYARPVPTETDESGADGGPAAPPTSAQVAQGVTDLLGEVDEAFSSDQVGHP